jgi:hypothetical protein
MKVNPDEMIDIQTASRVFPSNWASLLQIFHSGITSKDVPDATVT